MEKKLIIAILFLLVLFPLISSVPPPQTNVNTAIGLEVQFPQIEAHRSNATHEFNFHVYNISDGLRLDNTSVNCVFNLYNPHGIGLINQSTLPFSIANQDWEIIVLGGNFTITGEYNVLVDCNDGGFGGFDSFEVVVTTTGSILTTADTFIFFILTIGSLFLFVLCLWGGIVLPFRNKRSGGIGEIKVIGVEWAKYPKIGLLFLSYVFLLWTLNLFLALATNFSSIQPFIGFFSIMFTVLNSASYPLFVVVFIIMFVLALKDLKLKALLDRGLSLGKGFSK